MIRIPAPLKSSQRDALRIAAKQQRRTMEDQAALYILDGLRRDGYLSVESPLISPTPSINLQVSHAEQ